MILKRRELVAAALVVLIGVAGYLNWSYQDTMRVRDDELYQETSRKLGEAQYVNSSSVENADDEETEENTEESEEKTEAAADNTGGENEEAEKSGQSDTGGADAASYFEQAKLDRETSRSQAMEILKETASNESFDEEARRAASEKIVKMSEYTEKEAQIENMAKAKGYKYICVYIDDTGANMIVQKDNFGEGDVVKLSELVSSELGIPSSQIKVVEYSN